MRNQCIEHTIWLAEFPECSARYILARKSFSRRSIGSQMTTLHRSLLALCSTATYGVWLSLVSHQYWPELLFFFSILLFIFLTYILWPNLKRMSLWRQILVGAGAGYLSSVISSSVVTLIMYGASQFLERSFPSVLYIYPVISLGWLYGMIIAMTLGWKSREGAFAKS